jgi:hypothetical protein
MVITALPLRGAQTRKLNTARFQSTNCRYLAIGRRIRWWLLMPKLASIDSISDDRNASETLESIAEFQRCARAVVAGLQKQAGSKDLLGAWRQGRLKRSGRLLAATGKYTFHGIGCRFEVNGCIIDVDFGPAQRHNGIDASKLMRFAESSFEWRHLEPRDIEFGLRQLQNSGVLAYPVLEPSPQLAYLAADLAPQAAQRSNRSKRVKNQ